MSTTARRVAAIPVRTSAETWKAICDLLAPSGSAAQAELASVSGLAAVLIAEEYTSTAPVIVTGPNPRVRVYTVHGTDAPDALEDEAPLGLWPCAAEDWSISFPCGAVDLDEMTAALAHTSRFTVRDLAEGIHLVEADAAEKAATALARPTIDLTELERP